jgi:hypothetical protein
MSYDLEALKAQFAARGGKVTQVAEGSRAIESDRKIYAAMREGKRVASDAVEMTRASEARFERQQEAYRAARYDGWSQAEALDYAENAK